MQRNPARFYMYDQENGVEACTGWESERGKSLVLRIPFSQSLERRSMRRMRKLLSARRKV